MMKGSTRSLEIRTENRYIFHPQGKKKCTQCELVYSDIKSNFDIHHQRKDGEYLYVGQCKKCLAKIRVDRKIRRIKDVTWYMRWLIPHLKHRAKQENIPFNLIADDLYCQWNLQGGKCYYCHEDMSFDAANKTKTSPHYNFPSVDKMIPQRGYVKGNIVWCKWVVNRMKSDLTVDEFINFCNKVTILHG